MSKAFTLTLLVLLAGALAVYALVLAFLWWRQESLMFYPVPLPADHRRVLASPDDTAHVAPFAHMLAGIGGVLDRVVDAYRTGGGVPYSAYGRAFRHGQGHINRPAFVHELPTAWPSAR